MFSDQSDLIIVHFVEKIAYLPETTYQMFKSWVGGRTSERLD